MKRLLMFFVAVTAAFILCACGGSQKAAADPIVGKWEVTKLVGDDGSEEDATAFGTVYNFDKDGTMTGIDNGKVVKATWKQVDTGSYVVTSDSNDMVFKLDGDVLTYEVKGNQLMPAMNFIFERK